MKYVRIEYEVLFAQSDKTPKKVCIEVWQDKDLITNYEDRGGGATKRVGGM